MRTNCFYKHKLSYFVKAFCLVCFSLHGNLGFAATYNVSDSAGLIAAITSINAAPGTTPLATANQINVTVASISLAGDLPVLLNGATVSSTVGGSTISGGDTRRLFATGSADLTLENITLADGLAQGVAPGNGGGGGMGAGGGVYIDFGRTLTLTGSTIQSCIAAGGNGGGSGYTGAGGNASFAATPATSASNGYTTGGAGGSGNVGSGGAAGGTGAGSNNSGANGGAGGYCAGGGGGGGNFAANIGGGGGGSPAGGSPGSNGGNYGSGGAVSVYGGGGGGFGGGGGSGGSYGGTTGGGGGGFGGGGGGMYGLGGGGSAASGGAYGGAGGTTGAFADPAGGGGGAGIGGAIFAAQGSTIVFSTGSSIPAASNSVTAGTGGGDGATSGQAVAPDIFLFKGAKIQFTNTTPVTAAFTILGDTVYATSSTNFDSGVQINGASTVTLSGTNTYQGATAVNAGTLIIGADNNLGTAPSVATPAAITLAGTTLRFSSPFTLNSNRGITMNGTSTFEVDSGTLSYSGIIAESGASGLTKTGAGTLSLGASPTYTGATTVSAGTLIFGATTSYTGATNITGGTLQTNIANAITNSSAVTLSNASGAALNLNNTNQTINTLSGGGVLGGNISLGSGTLTIKQLVDGTFAGNITGTGSIVLSNLSTNNLTLSGSNSYSGSTTVNAATLITTGDGIANTSAISVALGATLTLNASSTIVTPNTYDNFGTHNTTIDSASSYGSIQSIGAVDLTGATINITGNATTAGTWTLISGSSVNKTGTTVNIPTSSGIYTWTDISTATSVAVQLSVLIPGFTAIGSLHQKIAGVLNNIANSGNINSGQQALLDAINASANDTEYNNNLQQLIPISNSYVIDFEMQNNVFREISTRVASLRDDSLLPLTHGFNAGETFSTANSMWISGSGSLTAQGTNGENQGYNAKTGVFLLGFDAGGCGNVLGVAGGFSTTHTDELSNAGFVNNTERYHGLMYGSYNYNNNNHFDWLVSGSFNHNISHRVINISGAGLTTYGNSKGYQLAAKLERSKGYDFLDSYRFTPLTYIQYVFVHQNPYDETGSVAALHVDEINKNIATLAAGMKFAFPIDAWQAVGMRELRATVTYDVINNDNNTTANFVVGSDSFTVVSSPVRLGVLLGAGMTFEVKKHLLFAINYDFECRARFTDHTLLAQIKYVF